jgi:MFS family permease
MVGGYVGDRVGRPWVASAALALVGAATLSYLPVADFLGFLAVSAVLGLGGFGTSMGPALVADSLPAAHRARGIGLFRLLTDLSQVTAPIAVGFLLDRAGSTPLIVGLALLPAVCAALLAAAFAGTGRAAPTSPPRPDGVHSTRA